ncbi:MAG: lipoyl(octanoyl) transferase LipB [Flavobacteriales bacterium TMED288]|nr:lipoyl(octanoyl) transferase [Flavobacteriales bacterium]MAJ98139.1 lipoyl(octanoyl) transferase [Flavobacteriales bacterium]RPG52958.1 MAG: lipoyl(octanoyl) transferase LipB [Flavobacteriales bacterium TMED288]|tara:strand:+ start:808 stop:1524 length:717 start_codon:yes stop_codon:yes gene_type:complete
MNNNLNEVEFHDLGLIDFHKAWEIQEIKFNEILDIKSENRKREKLNQVKIPTKSYLLFCQHYSVFTIGKSGKISNLLINKIELDSLGIKFHKINRGGDITYHGPGQLVCYPIFDLDNFFTDIHKYLRLLEEVVIRTLLEYDIKSGRIEGQTGVWIDRNSEFARKICAFGVKSSRWVTMHGLALNVNNDLSNFTKIIPCGIKDKSVTSMNIELGIEISMNNLKEKLKKHFEKLFSFKLC